MLEIMIIEWLQARIISISLREMEKANVVYHKIWDVPPQSLENTNYFEQIMEDNYAENIFDRE